MRCNAWWAKVPLACSWRSCTSWNLRRQCAFLWAPHNAHARRKFDELLRLNLSPVGTQVIQHIAARYKIENEIKGFSADDRHAARQANIGRS
jgi:hypothetical protein